MNDETDNPLRDVFAAAALAGAMAKAASTTLPSSTREALAHLAYQMADAMLVERSVQKPQHPPAFMG